MLQNVLKTKANIHWVPFQDEAHTKWIVDSMTESHQYG